MGRSSITMFVNKSNFAHDSVDASTSQSGLNYSFNYIKKSDFKVSTKTVYVDVVKKTD